mgnify:CR=1 FL=1
MTVPNMTIVRAEQLCKLSLKPISSAKIKSSQRPKTVKVYPSLEQSDIESIKTVTAIGEFLLSCWCLVCLIRCV